MLRCALACFLVLGGGPRPAVLPSQLQAPLIRVESGAARLAEGRTVRVLDRRSEAVALAADAGWVETGACTEVTLAWRGQAGARIDGPSSFQVERRPALTLVRFQVAEIEVRRGTLALGFDGVGTLEVGPGALQARSLPGGVLELLNRGGTALELARPGRAPLAIPAWQRVRLRVPDPGTP